MAQLADLQATTPRSELVCEVCHEECPNRLALRRVSPHPNSMAITEPLAAYKPRAFLGKALYTLSGDFRQRK